MDNSATQLTDSPESTRIVSDMMLGECGRELMGQADDKLWSIRGLVDAYIA